jgi:hypothetical protein
MHKTVSEAELKGLSRLQKALLKKGLEAHCVRALDQVYGIEPEGSFGIKGMLKEVEDQQERASRRAGASRSLERLIERGLLACCGRGSWRLTPSGVKAARKLYPDIKELTAKELERHNDLRVGIQSWIQEHPQVTTRRHKPRQKSPSPDMNASLSEEEIEIDF